MIHCALLLRWTRRLTGEVKTESRTDKLAATLFRFPEYSVAPTEFLLGSTELLLLRVALPSLPGLPPRFTRRNRHGPLGFGWAARRDPYEPV